MYGQQSFIDPVVIAMASGFVILLILLVLNRSIAEKEIEIMELKQKVKGLEQDNRALKNHEQVREFIKRSIQQ